MLSITILSVTMFAHLAMLTVRTVMGPPTLTVHHAYLHISFSKLSRSALSLLIVQQAIGWISTRIAGLAMSSVLFVTVEISTSALVANLDTSRHIKELVV